MGTQQAAKNKVARRLAGHAPKILKTLNCTATALGLVGSSSADTELKKGADSWFFARSLRGAAAGGTARQARRRQRAACLAERFPFCRRAHLPASIVW